MTPQKTPVDLPRAASTNGIAYYHSGRSERTADGAPLLLIHGVGLSADSWFEQVNSMRAKHTLYALDLPGHGQSARLVHAQPTLAQFSERIAVFIDDLIGEPVILVGHSLGALIALDLACRSPRLCRGVAALNAVYRRTAQAGAAVRERATTLSLDGTLADIEELATAPLARWFGDNPIGHEKELAAHCRTWLMNNDRQGYAAAYSVFAHEDGPSDASLASLDCPALFLTADGDTNSTPAMTQAMARLTPHGYAHVIERARHLAQLTHAAQTNSVLEAFFTHCAVHPGTPVPGAC